MEQDGWDGTLSTLLAGLNLDQIDWQRELERIGGVTGIGVASYLSSRLAVGLGLRIVYAIGGAYGGGALGLLAFHLLSELRSGAPKQD